MPKEPDIMSKEKYIHAEALEMPLRPHPLSGKLIAFPARPRKSRIKRGTRSCFVHNKCSHPECAEANQAYLKKLSLPHGNARYTLQGCRCPVCKLARRVYRKLWKEKQNAKEKANQTVQGQELP